MQDTGERQIPKFPGTLEGLDPKHLVRYRWASTYTRGKRVYDIACGTGYGSLILEASHYVGLDNSPETVKYANKYYGDGQTVTFSEADACNLSQTLEPADIIVSFETIEHLKNPEAFLNWCKSHGRILLISSPIRGSFGRSRFHLFEYRREEFETVLKKYFSEITVFLQGTNGEIISAPSTGGKGVAVVICQP
jgi:2-polyprenyl-3-methyl-5-hydroxy-6-metoxy-1,4-benzoquinol methylase